MIGERKHALILLIAQGTSFQQPTMKLPYRGRRSN